MEMSNKTLSVNEDTYGLLCRIQATLQLKENKKTSFNDLIYEMCTNWDSLHKSYEQLRELPELEDK